MEIRPKRKGGRPPKKIKRQSMVRLRLTVSERFLFEQKSKRAGMGISDFIRHSVMSSKVMTRFGEAEISAHRVLAGMANNLNQLTKKAHHLGLLIMARRCQDLISEIEDHMKTMNDL
ncbi:plasmid mobilization relaxosome protein MobC [Pedobacter sp. Leaf194]|uniref:plasmid mobilization protein n=1 Tax=Pedobacter sp. Leaf194 TaxID=1736297 RepID=UPI00138F4301|nr:plasmid mobilization relaxosome protein MobC [Pedobacter sp. Leaf194]